MNHLTQQRIQISMLQMSLESIKNLYEIAKFRYHFVCFVVAGDLTAHNLSENEK